MKDDDHLGDRYQEMTKYSRTVNWTGARPAQRPEPFKEYRDAKRVKLAGEVPEGSLWDALQNRRSRRLFSDEPLDMQTLSRLVWAAQGATAVAGQLVLRTAPSAGALYPVETYLVANRVEGLDRGVHHFNVRESSLETVREGDYGTPLAEAALGQGMCRRAAIVFCWTAIAGRSKWKYAQRAWRYIYLDAGHICENVYLAAEGLGLGCCGIGAFIDDEVNALLGVDGEEETVVYLAAAGPLKQ